jgi:hypothetical protein
MTDLISIALTNLGLTLTATAFMAGGLLFVLYDRVYKNKVVRVPGSIVGIEKYISEMRTGNTRSSCLMYRPIVRFMYHGEETFFTAGLSKNTISDHIGDQLDVEYIQNLPASVRIAGRRLMRHVGLLLLSVSVIMLWVAFTIDQIGLGLKVVRLAAPFLINYLLFTFLFRTFEKQGGVAALMTQNNPIKTQEELEALDIFWSNDQIQTEVNRAYKPFLYITPILIGLVSWPGYLFAQKFFRRPYVRENFNADLLELETAKVFFNQVLSNSAMEKEFIIMSMCCFFVLMLSYSFLFTVRKTT